MVGIESLYGVWDVKTARGRPRESEALELLQKIADQVKPICTAHKWKVTALEEFVPPNPGLLGMNVNRQKIFIRLRPASNVGSFYPYEDLLHTMLHELVHMEIGPHNAAFYKMLDELRDECEKLMRQGITGRNMPFAGDGKSLGGGRAPVDVRGAARRAAEKRQRQQAIMGGGYRLGGSADSSRSASERAAAAAVWRQAVSRGCAATQDGESSQVGEGCGSHGGASSTKEEIGKGGWDCTLCTLRNGPSASACGACGTARPTPIPAPGRLDASLAEDKGEPVVRAAPERRPRKKLSRPSSWKEQQDTISEIPPATAAGAVRAASPGRLVGRPARSTWVCRSCPFAFPNAAERQTCESCGVRRTEGDPTVARVPSTASSEGPPWACNVCTFVNVGSAMACGACETARTSERPPRPAAVASDIIVCGVCTLRNREGAQACKACGVPLDDNTGAVMGRTRDGSRRRPIRPEGVGQRPTTPEAFIDLS